MLNTEANLFTLLLIPLEQGRFEHLNTNVTGLGEAVRDKAGKRGAKTSNGGKKVEKYCIKEQKANRGKKGNNKIVKIEPSPLMTIYKT